MKEKLVFCEDGVRGTKKALGLLDEFFEARFESVRDEEDGTPGAFRRNLLHSLKNIDAQVASDEARTRKLAKVYYEKLKSGDIKFVGFENIKTRLEIISVYGQRVWELYMKSETWMVTDQSIPRGSIGVIELYSGDISFAPCEGLCLDKETFSTYIAAMKKAGACLVEAIREGRGRGETPIPEIKEITI